MSDIKPSETNAQSAEAATPVPAATPAAAEQQISLAFAETKNEASTSEAPASNVLASETAKAEIAAAPQAIEPPKSIESMKPIDLPEPEAMVTDKPVASIQPATAANQNAVSSRTNRFAALAASVAFAAAIGSLVGALASSVIARPAPTPAQSPMAALDLSQLQDTIATIRKEIAAMKASVDSGARISNAQFAKAAERFERIERAQSAAAAQLTKSIESLDRRTESAKDVTGSVRPQPAAAHPSPATEPLRGPVLGGWIVRNVNRNVALIQGRRMGVIEVETGDIVPGVGRIQAIRKHADGRWVVVTSKGLITSR